MRKARLERLLLLSDQPIPNLPEQRTRVAHHDKYSAQAVFRAVDGADRVPGVVRSFHDRTVIANALKRDLAVEFIEVGRRLVVKTSTIVQGEGFTAPARVSVVFAVEVEQV